MKSTAMHSLTMCAIFGFFDACTTTSLAPSTVPSTAPVVTQTTSQIRASDRMLYWHEEARELHAMATHREREVELVLRTQSGPSTNEFAKQMRVFVHQLYEAAEYAEAQAKEAEREIPPDMIRLHVALENSVKAGIKEIDAAATVLGASLPSGGKHIRCDSLSP